MSTTFDLDQLARTWLGEGPTDLSDRVLQQALEEVHRTRQRRTWLAPWRGISMNAMQHSPLAQAAAVAAVGVLAIGAAVFVIAPLAVGPSPTPTASPASPTAPPAPGTVTLRGTISGINGAPLHGRILVYDRRSTAYPPIGATSIDASTNTWTVSVPASAMYCLAAESVGEAAGPTVPVGATAWSAHLSPGGGWTLDNGDWGCIQGSPPASISLAVPDGVLVSGTVLDVNGEPFGASTTLGRRVTVLASLEGGLGPAATTGVDELGRFAMTLPPGDWSLLAMYAIGNHGSWTWAARVPVGAAPVTGIEIVRPGEPTTIGGRIVDARGNPVRATVRLRDSWAYGLGEVVDMTETDGDGRWSFQPAAGMRICLTVDTGPWELSFGPHGLATTAVNADCFVADADEPPIELTLPAPVHVSGTILDQDGRAVGPAGYGTVRWEARSVHASLLGLAFADGWVQPDGTYAIDVFPGTWQLAVTYTSYRIEESDETIQIDVGSRDVEDLAITLPIVQSPWVAPPAAPTSAPGG